MACSPLRNLVPGELLGLGEVLQRSDAVRLPVTIITPATRECAYRMRMAQRLPDNEDPTSEEEALEFDGAQTDQLDDTHRLRVVTASEGGKGGIGFDDRGQARWQWKTEIEIGSDSTGTFNELKALENSALALQGEEPPQPEPSKTTGYDPYASGVFVKPKIGR